MEVDTYGHEGECQIGGNEQEKELLRCPLSPSALKWRVGSVYVCVWGGGGDSQSTLQVSGTWAPKCPAQLTA